MPVCAVSIPSWETSDVINPTPVPIEFDMSKNGTLQFELYNYQTVYFQFRLEALTPLQVSIQFSIYNALSLTLVSSLTSTDTLIETNIDLAAGKYVICLRAIRGSYRGTAKADYYGYSRVVNFEPKSYSGDVCNFALTTQPLPKPCDRPMKWELLEGSLPNGLVLNMNSGLIAGTLPWLDCLDDDTSPYNNMPSANMFYKTLDTIAGVTIEPWGRRWKFKLRISMVDQPENYQDEWFCISIYNDWSRTDQKYMDDYNNGIEVGEVIKQIDKPRYTIGLCPPDPCKIDKDVEDVIKIEIGDWEGVTEDDDILILELPDIDDIDPNEIKNKKLIEYSSIGGVRKKTTTIIEDNADIVYCNTFNHASTIDMDNDVIEIGNIIVPPVQKGYVQETITIELDSYEHFLTFRHWLGVNLRDERVKEYANSKLLNLFLVDSDKVEYAHIYYDPKVGYDFNNSGVSDPESLGLSDAPKHFIYIYFKVDELPEVKYLEDIINTQTVNNPIDIRCFNGDRVEVILS